MGLAMGAVEQGAPGPLWAGDALLGLYVLVLAGVGVDGGGQQVRLGGEGLQQVDVLVHQRHARPGLDQGAAFLVRLVQHRGEDPVLGDGLLVFHPGGEINIGASVPGEAHLALFVMERVQVELLVLNGDHGGSLESV